jgi:hypothetical protein
MVGSDASGVLTADAEEAGLEEAGAEEVGAEEGGAEEGRTIAAPAGEMAPIGAALATS